MLGGPRRAWASGRRKLSGVVLVVFFCRGRTRNGRGKTQGGARQLAGVAVMGCVVAGFFGEWVSSELDGGGGLSGLFGGKAQLHCAEAGAAIGVQRAFTADCRCHTFNLLLQFEDFSGGATTVDQP